MMKLFNPDATARPASNYSHGALIPAGAERLMIAGQVGIAPEAGMKKTDLVKVVVYVTQPDVTAAYRAIRDEVMEGHAPPMTYLVIAGLAAPGMLVEIEGEAVRSE
jgi:enamine deaminase RidA (YjgF/YER057c/UK114 family)